MAVAFNRTTCSCSQIGPCFHAMPRLVPRRVLGVGHRELFTAGPAGAAAATRLLAGLERLCGPVSSLLLVVPVAVQRHALGVLARRLLASGNSGGGGGGGDVSLVVSPSDSDGGGGGGEGWSSGGLRVGGDGVEESCLRRVRFERAPVCACVFHGAPTGVVVDLGHRRSRATPVVRRGLTKSGDE